MLTTSVVGSYTRPRWLLDAIKRHRRGLLSTDELEELKDMAKLLTIKEMEDAGIDVITDGEQGRTSFYAYMAEACTGFGPRDREASVPQGKLEEIDWRHKSLQERPVVKGEVRWIGEPLPARECRFLKEHTNRRVKVTIASPTIILRRLWRPSPTYPTEDSFIEALITLCREEIDALIKAGADFIQLDAPELTTYADFEVPQEVTKLEMAKSVELINRVLPQDQGVRLGLHVCWGNIKGTHRADGPLMRIYPWLLEVKVDQLVLELASPRHEEDLEVFKEYPSDKEIGAGVLDVKTPDVEPVRIVKKRIERLLQHIAPEKLWLNGDCGFAPTWDAQVVPRRSCYEKLRSLVMAAREERDALSIATDRF